MKQIVWSKPAQADFATIDTYYRQRDALYAQRLLELAVAAGEFLRRHPEAGEAIEKTKLRKWRVADTPYILLYRVTPGAVRVSRVVHAKRDWRRFVE